MITQPCKNAGTNQDFKEVDKKMEREDFLKRLETVEPALADNNLVPILQHFWFDGERVMAYNDQIAISTPCPTSFKGAVQGSTILSLLKASTATDVKLTAKDDALRIQVGRSDIKLGLRPVSDFIFEMPEPNEKANPLSADTSGALKRAIQVCMNSVSNDTSVPDQLGITLIPDGEDLHFYATNNKTLSYSFVTIPKMATGLERIILSGTFCQQLLRLTKTDDAPILELYKDRAMLVAGETILHGRLIFSSHPLPYEQIIERHLEKGIDKKLVDIPNELDGILTRAMIITDGSSTDRTATDVVYDNGALWFDSKSDRGHIEDYIMIKHPDVTTKIDPKLIKAGIGMFDKMLITNKAAIMAGDDSYYLVSAAGSK
jgi:DNA polymerase III sliding clamp (beta) subunit (PCNA family)